MPVVKPKPSGNPIEDAIFHLTPEYGWVLLVASFLLIQCYLYGFIIVGYYRKKVFTQEFLSKEFGKIHKDATTEEIKEGGYPDMGAGVYSQKLAYGDWLIFNKAQRIHQNFLETLAVSVILLLIAGLNFPITATIFGTFQVIGRFCSVAYISTKGQAHILRVASSLLSVITNIAQFILCFIVVVQILSRK